MELDEKNIAILASMAEKDPNSDVRETALIRLAETGDKKYVPIAVNAIEKDPAIKVVSAGLSALLELDKEAALATARNLEKEEDEGLIMAIAGIYAEAGDPQRLAFFEEKFDKVGGFTQFSFLQEYAKLAVKSDADGMLRAAGKMKNLAMSSQKMFWMRYMSTKSINDLHASLAKKIDEESDASKKAIMQSKDAEIVSILQDIKAWETDERVKNMYANFPDPPLKP